MTVTKTAFAEMAGIDKSTVTVSISRGKLVPTNDGYIDTDQPDNAIYLAKRRQKGGAPAVVGIRKPKPKKPPKPPAAHASAPLEQLGGVDLLLDDIDDGAEDPDRQLDQTDKLKASVRLQTAQAQRHELKYAQDKKLVIPIELVDRMVAKARSELKTRLQDMPRRLTARLAAMARSGDDDKEIQATLEREIDDVLQNFAKALEVGLD